MLLALGPLQLDPTVRTVVVGLVTASDPACVAQLAPGADALWLAGSPTPEEVAAVQGRSGLPVGVTVDQLAAVGSLVDAGVVAIEPAGSLDVADVLDREDVALWCTPGQAQRAIEAGAPEAAIVVEGGDPAGPGIAGATVGGDGPAAWGAVLAHLVAGARVVRTTDVRSARRVATVADRLLSARASGEPPS